MQRSGSPVGISLTPRDETKRNKCSRIPRSLPLSMHPLTESSPSFQGKCQARCRHKSKARNGIGKRYLETESIRIRIIKTAKQIAWPSYVPNYTAEARVPSPGKSSEDAGGGGTIYFFSAFFRGAAFEQRR